MSTNSSISIADQSGKVIGIYCHFDGYLEHVGRILFEHYKDEEKICQLMQLGNLSSLGAELGEKQDWLNPVEGTCIAYGRDRGEKNQGPVVMSSIGRFLQIHGREYNYYFSNGSWSVIRGRRVMSLEEALSEL